MLGRLSVLMPFLWAAFIPGGQGAVGYLSDDLVDVDLRLHAVLGEHDVEIALVVCLWRDDRAALRRSAPGRHLRWMVLHVRPLSPRQTRLKVFPETPNREAVSRWLWNDQKEARIILTSSSVSFAPWRSFPRL